MLIQQFHVANILVSQRCGLGKEKLLKILPEINM